MGYFSNGSSGMDYEYCYCWQCLHKENCPIWDIHLMFNYEQFETVNGNQQLNNIGKILNEFIPQEGCSNGKCKMYINDGNAVGQERMEV